LTQQTPTTVIRPVSLDIYRTRIPMRGFEHAAASRDAAEAVVTRVTFADGATGWGETLPRDYVTGETIDTVVRDLAELIWPACAGRDFATADDLERIPVRSGEGRCIQAAACAMELPLAGRLLAAPGKGRIRPRVSGVLGWSDPAVTARRLRLMRWFGLRDFKLKCGLGEDVDRANLQAVHERIGKAVAKGRCSLRVDINGAWDADQTPQRLSALRPFGVCVVEQPVRCSAAELVRLARQCELPLMADESLITDDDAAALLAEPKRIWWNLRISKNGGLWRTLKLAESAAAGGVRFTVGCMVGETGILSAAQRRLLQLCPAPRFVEGNYGRFLLTGDLAARSPRFGYGGRLSALRGPGLGVRVDPAKLDKYATHLRTLPAE